jgi:acyl-homoserine-lactone acylase
MRAAQRSASIAPQPNLRIRITATCLALLTAASCADHAGSAPATSPAAQYNARVLWTSHGVPHFIAEDLPSVAYAAGYRTSKDVVCILADQFIRLRSERAKYLGPGELDANVTSDFGILASGVRATALATFAEIDAESRSLIVAYAAGYNRYLAETPTALLPQPCRGAAWVQPIQPVDLWTYYYYLSMDPEVDSFFMRMARAAPDLQAGLGPPPASRSLNTGNAWAIGRDRSANGRGMLLANPHLPWHGPRRLYEQQITVAGSLHVYGAGWVGLPLIAIGFNEDVAWTHTRTMANHATLYKLRLVPGKPTHYVFDGQEREMTPTVHAIEVLQPDGSLSVAQRTLYRSHYGPMLGDFGTPWSDDAAYTYRDANHGNVDLLRTYLAMNRAHGLEALENAQAQARGLSWHNVIAVSKDGAALFYSASRTPALSEAAESAFRDAIVADYETGIMRNMREVLLPGDSSLFDWQDRDSRIPGIHAHSAGPRLQRSDFVANAGDSHWLINPAAPLSGFSALFGDDPTERRSLPWTLLSASTRMSLELMNGTTASGGKISFEELSAVPYDNRALIAELLRDAVVERCKAQPVVEFGGENVDLSAACAALAAWNLRVDADSAGAALWRAFLADFYNSYIGVVGLFADAFDPADPIASPRMLTANADSVSMALADAVVRLRGIGVSESVTLGSLQFAQRGTRRIPVHGGADCEGAFNVVGYDASDAALQRGILLDALGLTAEGYPINAGSSFMLVTSFTDRGPVARSLLTYSQSADPDSPHFADQTQLFAQKSWRDVRFSDAEIRSDPDLREEIVTGPRE